ncbi:MAG: c-type cytochrome [Bacteroidota bacterium]|nr:c-type cytochrome [Bacteroidota bacterium]MDP4244806.1 c-type cytochrome [Bacteroidota bacterium]MDP4258435.1 c-type cytochrome [Bacteroidota bacterium]
MIYHRPVVKWLRSHILLLSTLILTGNGLYAQDGHALFQANCASCHSPFKDVIGPALKGVSERIPDKNLLHEWVHNSNKVLASGNAYFKGLYAKYNTPMTAFGSQLSDPEIDAIIKYVETAQPPGPPPTANGTTPAPEEDNTLLYGILTLILAIIMFVMLQVNSSLKKLSDDKEGIPAHEPIPFYRNKVYITFGILVLFIVGGYFLTEGAIGLGRTKNYQPVQPIFYSHKVHAGINQISCLYCHGNAWESKHATVPSLNVCMNCHAAINEYTQGPKLIREDGSEVNGTAEIEKLYSYTGYDPKTGKYTKPAKPVEWVKIHNLPDHVFFSHAQHIRAGKVQCQTCHGPIQQMDEVKQFAELSMGWCINCHRTTKVNFPDSTGAGNKFYSIYERFHNDLKSGKMDSVTVESIGGTECQKCHY